MKRSYSKEIVNAVLKDIKLGLTNDEASKKYNIPVQTIYNWVSKHHRNGFGVTGLDKIFEKENQILKDLIIEKDLEIHRLKLFLSDK